MPMHPLDILIIVGSNVLSVVGVGIALAVLILRADARAEDKFNKAMERLDSTMARGDERFDNAMARGDERFDNATARGEERFDNATARG